MPRVSLPSGTEISYEAHGVGPPLVQIHGSALGQRNFDAITPFLRDRFQVFNFDLPGYGSSQAISEAGLDGWAKCVAGLIPSLGLKRAHIHGTSLGGMIGMVLAAHYPDVVDHLVLSSFMCRYDCAARLMRRTWIEAAESSGMKAVADLTAVAGFSRNFLNSARADFQLEQLRDAFSESEPGTFVAAARALLEVDLSPLADTIRAHVLLIGGAEDTMTPSDPGDSGYGMKQLEGELRNGRLVVLNSCGHYVVIEQPAETAQQIIDFICG